MRYVFVLLALLSQVGPVHKAPALLSPPMAAPRLIMFHGGMLEDPVFLTDHDAVVRFYSALEAAPPIGPPPPTEGPSVDITFFWYGPAWESYIRDPNLLRTLRAEDANAYCPGPEALCMARYHHGSGEGQQAIHVRRRSTATAFRVTPELQGLLSSLGIRLEPSEGR